MSEAEFDSLQAGEILVCQMTNPAWQVLYGKIIAVVTDAGGTVSHPAVLAREYGIPAVVGHVGRHIDDQDRRPDPRRRQRRRGRDPRRRSGAARSACRTDRDRMAHDAAISRSVLSDQVKDRLLQAILDGRYPPGARIVETRVARELGTSQAPVREALRDLEALGVVEIDRLPRSSRPPPTADELLEAFVVRAELEALGARLAIPSLTDADLDDLAGLRRRRCERAAEAGDSYAEAAADAAFHGHVMRARRQRHPRARVAARWSRSRARTSRSSSPGVDRRAIADRHAPVLDALRRARPRRAPRAAIRAPLRRRRRDARQPLCDRTEPADDGAAGRHAAPPPHRTRPEPRPRPRKDTMNDQLQLTRGDLGGSRPPARGRLRRRAARARARRPELPQLPARRRPHLARGHAGRARHRLAPGRREGRRATTAASCTFTGPWPAGPHPEGHRRGAGAAHGGGRAAPLPQRRRAATAARRSCSWAASRTTASRMGLIEAGRRGALQVASETTVIDEDGRAVDGLRGHRSSQAHRGHRAVRQGRPEQGRREVLGRHADLGHVRRARPTSTSSSCPAIDGNFDPATQRADPVRAPVPVPALAAELLPHQRAAGARPRRCPWSTTTRCAARRAAFVERFCERPFFFIRAATPQVLLDEVDRIL